MKQNIAIIGASGTIGVAFTHLLSEKYPHAHIHCFSQHFADSSPEKSLIQKHPINYLQESSIENAAILASQTMPLDMVLVTNGILHNADKNIMPEKSLSHLSADKMQHLFYANTIVPALIMKHFLPKLNKKQPAAFAVLSARVGSISDNRLGGWYSYRASKAALNMLVKNAALEIKRTHPQAVVVGLHPGTTASPLSKPFAGNVPADKLFTPEYAAQKLLDVLDTLTPTQTGRCFAWDGLEILP